MNDLTEKDKLRLEIERIRAEIDHRFAETNLANKKIRWYEIVLIVSFVTAIMTIGATIARFF
jgi:hypothetical protein